MIRLEIIANNTVEEDIQKALNEIEDGFYYTRLNNVHGRGKCNPRMGDAVWPEENFVYIIYTDIITSKKMIDAVKKIKEDFVTEGIKIFKISYADVE